MGLIAGAFFTARRVLEFRGRPAAQMDVIVNSITAISPTSRTTFQPENAFLLAGVGGGAVIHKLAVWGEVNKELPRGVNI